MDTMRQELGTDPRNAFATSALRFGTAELAYGFYAPEPSRDGVPCQADNRWEQRVEPAWAGRHVAALQVDTEAPSGRPRHLRPGAYRGGRGDVAADLSARLLAAATGLARRWRAVTEVLLVLTFVGAVLKAAQAALGTAQSGWAAVSRAFSGGSGTGPVGDLALGAGRALLGLSLCAGAVLGLILALFAACRLYRDGRAKLTAASSVN